MDSLAFLEPKQIYYEVYKVFVFKVVGFLALISFSPKNY